MAWTAAARAAAAAARGGATGLKGGTILQLQLAKRRKQMVGGARRHDVLKDFKSRKTARLLVKHMEGSK